MARPRIFISSTYYDLKYVRSSLEQFIDSLGFDAVLSEKGAVAYAHDVPLDESCYREVQNSDVYVLMVGGRYGSEASQTRGTEARGFYDRYESITKLEFKAAVERDIPIYVLIERSVYSEYQTFLRNRDKSDVAYAHVDSANVFHFIEDVLAQPRNNPVQPFDRFSDIEAWLREQWAGLFRELLHRTSSQQQLASLAAQVNELAAVNETLKRYLEEVMSKVAPDDSAKIILKESERLQDARVKERLRRNNLISFYAGNDVTLDGFIYVIQKAQDLAELIELMRQEPSVTRYADDIAALVERYPEALVDLNTARDTLGLPHFTDRPSLPEAESTEPSVSGSNSTTRQRSTTRKKAT